MIHHFRGLRCASSERRCGLPNQQSVHCLQSQHSVDLSNVVPPTCDVIARCRIQEGAVPVWRTHRAWIGKDVADIPAQLVSEPTAVGQILVEPKEADPLKGVE